MRLLLVLFIGLALTTNAHSFEGSPKEQVKLFFKGVIAGEPDKALDQLFSSNPTIAQKTQQITNIKNKITTVHQSYGQPFAYEQVYNEKLSTSIYRVVAVAKHKLHPIVWEFYFYKPEKDWIVSQVLFADKFRFLDKKD